MSSSGYLVEDRFFCQRSEGTSIIYLQGILVPVLTNLTLNHLKIGCREGLCYDNLLLVSRHAGPYQLHDEQERRRCQKPR